MKRYALPVLISLILSACAAVPRPAFDTELYSHYRETEVTAQRGGVIGYFGARKRGARNECFPAADKHEFRGYTVGTGSVNRKNMELVGRVGKLVHVLHTTGPTIRVTLVHYACPPDK